MKKQTKNRLRKIKDKLEKNQNLTQNNIIFQQQVSSFYPALTKSDQKPEFLQQKYKQLQESSLSEYEPNQNDSQQQAQASKDIENQQNIQGIGEKQNTDSQILQLTKRNKSSTKKINKIKSNKIHGNLKKKSLQQIQLTSKMSPKQLKRYLKAKYRWKFSQELQMFGIIQKHFLAADRKINWKKVTQLCSRARPSALKQHYNKILQRIRNSIKKEIQRLDQSRKKIQFIQINKIRQFWLSLSEKQIVQKINEHKSMSPNLWFRKELSSVIGYHKILQRKVKVNPSEQIPTKSKQQKQQKQNNNKTQFNFNKRIPPKSVQLPQHEQKYKKLYILKNIILEDSQMNQKDNKNDMVGGQQNQAQCAYEIIKPSDYKNYSFKQKIQKGFLDFTNDQEMTKQIDEEILKLINQVNDKIKKMIEIDKKIQFLKGKNIQNFITVKLMDLNNKNTKKSNQNIDEDF